MKIRITQDLVFRDHKNNYLFTIHKGTILEEVVDMGTYFVTSKGGIYKDECEVLE